MLLAVSGSLAAMSLATLVLLAMCRAGVHPDETLELAVRDLGAGERAPTRSEVIARRTGGRRRQSSTDALRRRHLASVHPADARR